MLPLKEDRSTLKLHGYVRGSKGCPLVGWIHKEASTRLLVRPPRRREIQIEKTAVFSSSFPNRTLKENRPPRSGEIQIEKAEHFLLLRQSLTFPTLCGIIEQYIYNVNKSSHGGYMEFQNNADLASFWQILDEMMRSNYQ